MLGSTGPVLIFTGLLYDLCGVLEVEFLPFYSWTGLWVAVFMVIESAVDAATLIRYVTRPPHDSDPRNCCWGPRNIHYGDSL
jgi:hypothetical protein